MSAREERERERERRKGGRTCLGYVFNFMLGMCREGCRKVIASKRGQDDRGLGRSYRDLVCGRAGC